MLRNLFRKRLGDRSRSIQNARHRQFRPGLEPLEDRILLDSATGIVVGRTLSAYSTADVQNQQVSITYTVYNQEPEPVTGVLLTDTLQSGVSFQSASQPPDRNGQELAWSLGTIEGFSRASVTLTVSRTDAALQLDAGARAFGTLNAGMVTDDAPAAILTTRTLPADQMASTPDANTTDPFIQEKAAELDYDPQRIFTYLNTDVGYESYTGSLRGARGTLWSSAGNSLDEASLGVALFRASGIPARYAQGTLSNALSRQLILSMFQESLRVLGCLEPGTQLSDPVNDPQLLAESRDHFWIEFDVGDGFRAADATLPGSVGQTFTTAQSTFSEVPDALRHKVTVRLSAEISSALATSLGLAPSPTTVLGETLNAVDLVGRSLSVGHFVSGGGIGGPVISSQTFTYAPYLRVNDNDGNPSDDDLFRGTDYQEVLTNFPLASQFLTGLFLDVTTLYPEEGGQRRSERVEKTLFDRIGFVARQGGGGGAISLGGDALPAFGETDVVTLIVSPVSPPQAALAVQGRAVAALSDALTAATAVSPDDPSQEAVDRVIALTRETAIGTTSLLGNTFLARSDSFADAVSGPLLVRWYFDSPRVIAVSNTLNVDPAGQQAANEVEFDLLRNSPRSHASPIQALAAERDFRFIRGSADSMFEGEILREIAAEDMPTGSAFETVATAVGAGAALIGIDRDNLATLSALDLSDEAKARITAAVLSGRQVITPTAMTATAAGRTTAWLEFEPASGNAVFVSEDGGHQATVAKATTYIGAAAGIVRLLIFAPRIALTLGGTVGTLAAKLILFSARGVGTSLRAQLAILDELKASVSANILPGASRILFQYKVGVLDAIDKVKFGLKASHDPTVERILVRPLPSEEFRNLGAGATGVAAAIIPEPLFTVPFGGADLQTVFRIGIRNLGAVEQTFTLSPSTVPVGFAVHTTLPRVRIPAGETAEIGICLSPVGPLAAPGTSVTFGLTATSETDPALTTSATHTFALPAVRGLSLEAAPAALGVSPGAAGSVALTFRSVGNVAESVALAIDLPPGLTASDLGSLALAPGESRSMQLTLTAAASTSLNSLLVATITATFGLPDSPLTRPLQIPVRVAVPGADAIASAAGAAGRLGFAELAARLADLSAALTNLFQNPPDLVPRGQALAALDVIAGLIIADPFLSAAAPALASATAQLSSAVAPAEVQAAIAALGSALADLDDALTGKARHGFLLQLQSNTATALPGAAALYTVGLTNNGSQPTTYDLSITGLPAGVSAVFDEPSVTLQPGQSRFGGADPITLSLTQTTGSLLPAEFVLTATARSAPMIARSAPGTLTVRDEFVSVPVVTATPAFTDPGGVVSVTARVLNAVNRVQEARVSYTVRNAGGTVVFTSPTVPLTLGLQTSLATVDLGMLDTTGYALGTYTLEVTVTDTADNPIPGGTSQGVLLVGTPVNAGVTVSPTVVPAGNATVTNTLTLNGQTVFPAPLTLAGQAVINQPGTDVALFGNRAYVVGTQNISVVDVSDPNNPTVQGTFAGNLLVQGGLNFVEVSGQYLVVGTHVIINANQFTLLVYDLNTDPLNPTLVGQRAINYPYIYGMVVQGNTVLLAESFITFTNGASHTVINQGGDFLTVDISDPANPVLGDVLFNTRGSPFGGNFNVNAVAAVTGTLAYGASSSSTGNNITTGVGRLLIVDTSNPANLPAPTTFDVPGTRYLTGIAVQGNRAVVIGSTGGYKSPFTNDAGFLGNITITILDISNPVQPVILNSLTTENRPHLGSITLMTDVRALGNGLFAVSNTDLNGSPAVMVFDPSDLNNILVGSVAVPTPTVGLNVAGGELYVTSPDGLSIYDIGTVIGVPVTASVQVPTNTGVSVAANTFSTPPTETIPGVGFDTLVWRRSLGFGTTALNITWQSAVTNMAAGEARDVTLGTTASATVAGSPVNITLPATTVTAEHFVALDPPTRSAPPGTATDYQVTLRNPSASAVTCTLSVQGVPANWISLPETVVVPAGGELEVALTLRSDAFAVLSAYGFTVTASGDNGAVDSVQGTLTLVGTPPMLDPEAHGVVATLTPTSASAGQGTAVRYVVRVTNTGSSSDTFNLTLAGLPLDVTAAFARTTVDIPPGAGNFRDVAFTLTPALGMAAGVAPFQVVVTSATHPDVSATADATLTVLSRGVGVSLTPASTNPGGNFQMQVTNTGTTTDTFDLALGGPAALVSSLNLDAVTLAPGASQMVSVNTQEVNFAVQGTLDLSAMATSRGNPAVQDSASGNLNIASSMGMTAAFDPASRVLGAPSATTFTLMVHNTGNTEDSYEAVITRTTGPVTASLLGLDGQPAQTVPLFRLPGLSTGAILLNANLGGTSPGTVTVQVRSLTDGSIVSTVVAAASVAGVVETPHREPPKPDPVVPDPDFIPPGPPGVVIPVTVKFLSSKSLFRNEAGVIVLDADGKINGIAPGQPGFLAAALARRKVLVRRKQKPGAINRLKLLGGQRLLFYLVQNSTLIALLGSNPENQKGASPVLFFSSAAVNPDQRTHLRVLGGGRKLKLRWEDLSRGDQDFNDVVLSLVLGKG